MSTTNHRSRDTIGGTWQLDPDRSSVEFRTRAMWGLATVKGHFDDYHGELNLRAEPAIELTIDAASLQTGNARRDKHLRSAAFFDAENHPKVQFSAESVELRGDTLGVRGRLSAGGRSIPVALDAHVREVGGDELEVDAATTVTHRELGMIYSPLGTISPHSELTVKAHLTRARERAAA